MRPGDILKRHPAPWQQVTYSDGSIRVFDAGAQEVGLLDILAFALGLANASVPQAA